MADGASPYLKQNSRAAEYRRSVRWLGNSLIIAASAVALGLSAAVLLEVELTRRSQAARLAAKRNETRYNQLQVAYAPFLNQDLHPLYFFFFRNETKNRVFPGGVVRLTPTGFRGPGPELAKGRRLAFLTGGSAAFGWHASSDTTTITGYLNRLQTRYFFVNAGVPTWNSTQEMMRVAMQLLELRPALIVAYNGSNDADLAGSSIAGTPAHFTGLATAVKRLQSGDGNSSNFEIQKFFPLLASRIRSRRATMFPEKRIAIEAPEDGFIPDSLISNAAGRYVSNLIRMRDMSLGAGSEFIAVYQPNPQLHKNVPASFALKRAGLNKRFHEETVRRVPAGLNFNDFGNIFDTLYEVVPVRKDDVTAETIFTDQWHLHDRGNEIVAQRLLPIIMRAR